MKKETLRIVYMGTPEFAVAPLSALLDGGYNVVGVVTVPDKPAGRGRQIQASAVKQYVVSYNSGLEQAAKTSEGVADQHPQIPILQPEKLKNPQWLEELAALEADLFIVVAFRMLPEVVFSMPDRGTFNLHSSLLPNYRGAAPINWAIINGETKTGVTTFFIDRQIDCGEIIDQREVEIQDTDNAGTLHDKLKEIGARLVVETVDRIVEGTISSRAQSEVEIEKAAPKIFKEDCQVDWNATGRDICNKIRGLAPYPAAWAEVGKNLTAKILEAHFVADNTENTDTTVKNEVGVVVVEDNKYLKIRCLDGAVYVDKIHPAGKRPMDIADFLRGYKF